MLWTCNVPTCATITAEIASAFTDSFFSEFTLPKKAPVAVLMGPEEQKVNDQSFGLFISEKILSSESARCSSLFTTVNCYRQAAFL